MCSTHSEEVDEVDMNHNQSSGHAPPACVWPRGLQQQALGQMPGTDGCTGHTTRHKTVALLDKPISQGARVLEDLLLIGSELGGGSLLQGTRQTRYGVVVWATLQPQAQASIKREPV